MTTNNDNSIGHSLQAFEDKSLAATLAARRRLERNCKTFAGFCNFMFTLEQSPFPTEKMRRLAAKARLRPFRPSPHPFRDEIVERCRKARGKIFEHLETADVLLENGGHADKEGRKRHHGKSSAVRSKPDSRRDGRDLQLVHGKAIHKT